MGKELFEGERYLKAQKRVNSIKGFYMNLFWYLAVNIIWILVILFLDAEESFFQYGFFGRGYGVVANAVFWGIGLFVHWFIVFGKNLTFSQQWEERKIKKLMEEDTNNTKY